MLSNLDKKASGYRLSRHHPRRSKTTVSLSLAKCLSGSGQIVLLGRRAISAAAYLHELIFPDHAAQRLLRRCLTAM